MKYFIKTYGCQMNMSDSERIAAVLESAGYKKTTAENNADLVALNVCSVRQSAIDRIFGNVKKYNKYRKNNPGFKTVITGCILENDRRKFEKLFDLVIDIREIEKLNCWLHSPPASQCGINSVLWSRNAKRDQSATQVQKGSTGLKPLWSQQADYFQIAPKYQNKFAAYVPIMTGCNNFCAYCVVPYTRGREYSRPAMEIIKEIERLVKKGYKEIILLGQNVNSYKSQIQNPKSQTNPKSQMQNSKQVPNYKLQITNYDFINFPILLRLINNIPGNFWIRFLTSHPKDMTEELIKTVARCDKCAEYIHLALQSGDNDILKAMNRRYAAEHFLGLTRLIRKHIPNAAISTDIIVGFPGETEEQFQNTAEVMKKAKFDMAYINKYSPRSGTAAAKLTDNINWNEKKRREKILTEILKETALENNKKYIGKTVEVLICESGIKNQKLGIVYGKTRSFKNVKTTIGSIVPKHSGPWSQNAERNKPQNANAKKFHSPEITSGTMEPSDYHKQYGNTYYHTKSFAGQFIKVKIAKADYFGLEGEIAK